MSKSTLSAVFLACLTQAAVAQQSNSDSTTTPAGSSVSGNANVASNETVIVTGTRGQPRTVTASPAPIDVIGAGALNNLSGGEPLRDELSELLPSFQSQDWVGSSSWNSIIRPAGLRGLGGADVLVLVNGKRRHNGALLDLSTGNLDNGADPVDLDLIPDAAIDHIEVLRDGASAQYGSDAIAGVINIILKKGVDGGDLNLHSGLRYAGDGATYGASTTLGFALPNDGSITLTATSMEPSAPRGVPQYQAHFISQSMVSPTRARTPSIALPTLVACRMLIRLFSAKMRKCPWATSISTIPAHLDIEWVSSVKLDANPMPQRTSTQYFQMVFRPSTLSEKTIFRTQQAQLAPSLDGIGT